MNVNCHGLVGCAWSAAARSQPRWNAPAAPTVEATDSTPMNGTPPMTDLPTRLAEATALREWDAHRACPCGKPIRLGGSRVTVQRKRGVFHYIDHADCSPCQHTKGWSTIMMKPYPARNEDKAWFKMLAAWDAGKGLEEWLSLSARAAG